jgi:hypothetical protein
MGRIAEMANLGPLIKGEARSRLWLCAHLLGRRDHASRFIPGTDAEVEIDAASAHLVSEG